MNDLSNSEKAILTKYDLYFEGRLSKLEAISSSLQNDVKEIKSDLRWLLGIMISFSIIMIGIMAKGFRWL